MNLAEIRAKVVTDETDDVALALIYLADSVESALHEIAERLNDLGTSVENVGL